MLRKDITGQTFGRLTVQNFHKRDEGGKALWLCKCTCGNFKTVEGYNLTSGRTQSCGCLSRDLSGERGRLRIKHGHARHKRSRTYSSFMHMVSRCHNPLDPAYRRYGGKGITVCRRWRHSFINFLTDMGERPVNKTLDRVSNSLGYFKANCRWSTPAEQQQNRGVTKLTPEKVRQIRGDRAKFTQTVLARKHGVSPSLIGSVLAGKVWANVTI
jgi:hypothetical protein